MDTWNIQNRNEFDSFETEYQFRRLSSREERTKALGAMVPIRTGTEPALRNEFSRLCQFK